MQGKGYTFILIFLKKRITCIIQSKKLHLQIISNNPTLLFPKIFFSPTLWKAHNPLFIFCRGLDECCHPMRPV